MTAEKVSEISHLRRYNMLNELIFVYIAGALTCSSIMMFWFNTNLPIHIVQVLYKLGYRKKDSEFWASETPVELWTRRDFSSWKFRALPAWLDELSECHGCLSFHIAFWVALLSALLTWKGYESFVFFYLAWGGWPYISNYALNKLKQTK